MSPKKNENVADVSSTIEPVQMDRVSGPGDDVLFENKTATFKRSAIIALSLVLFVAVLTVIFVLPKFVTAPTRFEQSVAPATSQPAAETNIQVPTKGPEQFAASRALSQELFGQILELVSTLESANVEAWAARGFSAAKSEIETGEKAYGEQRYADAVKIYTGVAQELRSLDTRAAAVMTESVDEGFMHINSGRSELARAAFLLALSINPAHSEAAQGLARAETLDQVLALLNEARGYEDLNELDAAIERYAEALELDQQAPGVQAAIAKIKRTQGNIAYNRLMSAGFTAFDKKQNSQALSAFSRATKLRPNAEEAKEAMAQVANRILANKISRKMSAAIESEKQEKWTDAAEHYRAAIKLDIELDGATASANRADGRALLDRQLNSIIGRPHRLADDAVYKEALAIQSRAVSTRPVGSRLSRQLKKLAHAMKVARTPIPVTFVSDNATDVSLYKVGPLGLFDRRSIDILPGHYVVAGRRVGFRDVRVEFDVSAEHQNAAITVRCEQKLAFGN